MFFSLLLTPFPPLQDMMTAYKSQRGKGALYTLSALVFFMKQRSLPLNQYVRAASEIGVRIVNYVDRKVNCSELALLLWVCWASVCDSAHSHLDV
jgi:hypothetical protein